MATAEPKSRGMMYRKELVSKTGTRLSCPTSVADRGRKSRCILLYRTVARNACDIPLSVVCPKTKFELTTLLRIFIRTDIVCQFNANVLAIQP